MSPLCFVVSCFDSPGVQLLARVRCLAKVDAHFARENRCPCIFHSPSACRVCCRARERATPGVSKFFVYVYRAPVARRRDR